MSTIKVKTELLPDFRVKQSIEYDPGDNTCSRAIDSITTKMVDVAALQLDQAVRTHLIALGWTPPPEAS